jgi:hypothetical protein
VPTCSSLILASVTPISLSVPRSIAERSRSESAKLPGNIQEPLLRCFDRRAPVVWLDAVRGACKQLPGDTSLSDPKVAAGAEELVQGWSAQGRGLKALCLAELRQDRVRPSNFPGPVARTAR